MIILKPSHIFRQAPSVAKGFPTARQYDPRAVSLSLSKTLRWQNKILSKRYFLLSDFKKLLLIICTLLPAITNAQNNAIFGGGISGGSSFSCGGASGVNPLPIELLSFTGKCAGKKNVLQWATASETNNDFFTIERSEDGFNWIIVGTIEGAGNSTNLLHYNYTDSEPAKVISYYRLKQNDFDGNFAYSKVISLHNCINDGTKGFILFPNPSNGILHLIIDNYEKEMLFSIGIYNDLGQTVYYSGTYQSTIDLSDLSNGVYSVLINIQEKNYAEKIVIIK